MSFQYEVVEVSESAMAVKRRKLTYGQWLYFLTAVLNISY